VGGLGVRIYLECFGIPVNEWSRKKIGKVAINNHATSNKSSYSLVIGNFESLLKHFQIIFCFCGRAAKYILSLNFDRTSQALLKHFQRMIFSIM
jgi:hypothetical protein